MWLCLTSIAVEYVKKVSEVSTALKTSENLRKPWKLHDLETYVSFPGNLWKPMDKGALGLKKKDWGSISY